MERISQQGVANAEKDLRLFKKNEPQPVQPGLTLAEIRRRQFPRSSWLDSRWRTDSRQSPTMSLGDFDAEIKSIPRRKFHSTWWRSI